MVNLERKNSIFSIPLNGVLKKERPIFDFVLNQVVSALGGEAVHRAFHFSESGLGGVAAESAWI
ncbi:hypothetical protein HPE56_19580 [Maribacter sp. ANRC-HE7]|uniref:Uncharacterized protein n=1 Tax=Maribacter aquimaris TaxID=2737171 RepID=A0ABR7V9T5_9FLAO|nr:hypothetical protein [Maribacter aquimaris]MBD0780006.1 hypothetical protein [Maribacter aquimaris]